MNEHIVKAKRKDNNEWVKGTLWKGNNHSYIIPYNHGITYKEETNRFIAYAVEVDSDTICRWTGLYDKTTDTPIYEHDVVFVTDNNGCSGQFDTGLGEVLFLEGLWYITGSVQNALYDINRRFYIEIKGNTIDNPEWMSYYDNQKNEETEFDEFLKE